MKNNDDQKPKDITVTPSPWTDLSIHSKQSSKVFKYIAWLGWILSAVILIWVLLIL